MLLPLAASFLLLLHLHILRASLEQAAEDIKTMTGTGATVFHGRNPSDIGMTLHFLLLFERQILIKLGDVRNLLELIGVALDLLLEVLHTLRHILGNLKIVLNFLNGRADFGLLKCILRESLVRLFEFADFLLLQIDLCHLPVIVRQLLIIVIIGRLLVFFQLVDWLALLAFVGWVLILRDILLRK